jgi:hypothetical protein
MTQENSCADLNSEEELMFEQDDVKKRSWSCRKHEGGYIQDGIDSVRLILPDHTSGYPVWFC